MSKDNGVLRSYYSNYSLELLSTVDYILQNIPALKDWKTDDEDMVVGLIGQEICRWSSEKRIIV